MTAGISSKLPSLAIIIPCYNNVETLAEALDSALAQDYPNFEVHICDNGSTDGSREMIASYSSPLLKPALHRDTVPRTDNWNRAYTAGANADYLVTLHADDRLAPGALRAIGRAAMRHPALIHGRFRQITYEGEPIPGRRFGWSYSNSGDAFANCCCSTIWSRCRAQRSARMSSSKPAAGIPPGNICRIWSSGGVAASSEKWRLSPTCLAITGPISIRRRYTGMPKNICAGRRADFVTLRPAGCDKPLQMG